MVSSSFVDCSSSFAVSSSSLADWSSSLVAWSSSFDSASAWFVTACCSMMELTYALLAASSCAELPRERLFVRGRAAPPRHAPPRIGAPRSLNTTT